MLPHQGTGIVMISVKIPLFSLSSCPSLCCLYTQINKRAKTPTPFPQLGFSAVASYVPLRYHPYSRSLAAKASGVVDSVGGTGRTLFARLASARRLVIINAPHHFSPLASPLARGALGAPRGRKHGEQRKKTGTSTSHWLVFSFAYYTCGGRAAITSPSSTLGATCLSPGLSYPTDCCNHIFSKSAVCPIQTSLLEKNNTNKIGIRWAVAFHASRLMFASQFPERPCVPLLPSQRSRLSFEE